MQPRESFVDIHCHLLPGIDDGAKSLAESLEMARIASDEGVETIVVTPHQLGAFAHNRGDHIRDATVRLQKHLWEHAVAVKVLPGADVRIEADLPAALRRGDVLSLGDHMRHVLLELPHEMYFPLQPCLADLDRMQLTGILSHPERNQGLLRKPELIGSLVAHGCLMQLTAGSLLGAFGPRCRELAELMLEEGWVHFVATDAHGGKSRRPLMQRGFTRVCELAGEEVAHQVCCRNPARVAAGQSVAVDGMTPRKRAARWLPWRKAG